jgi:hypothetical protein
MKYFATIALMGIAAVHARSMELQRDVMIIDGSRYENMTITKANAIEAAIIHENGCMRVEIETLPADIQKNLEFDTAAAARYREALAEKARELTARAVRQRGLKDAIARSVAAGKSAKKAKAAAAAQKQAEELDKAIADARERSGATWLIGRVTRVLNGGYLIHCNDVTFDERACRWHSRDREANKAMAVAMGYAEEAGDAFGTFYVSGVAGDLVEGEPVRILARETGKRGFRDGYGGNSAVRAYKCVGAIAE